MAVIISSKDKGIRIAIEWLTRVIDIHRARVGGAYCSRY